MELTIIDHTDGQLKPEQKQLAQDLLQAAAQKLALGPDDEMSLTFVRNPEIKDFNRQYRGVDRATDVISFAINDDDDAIVDAELAGEMPKDLGDMFISIDKVAEQALFLGHSQERELGYLLVHGFLHLNGYDHQEKEDEKRMFKLQKEILDDYGLER